MEKKEPYKSMEEWYGNKAEHTKPYNDEETIEIVGIREAMEQIGVDEIIYDIASTKWVWKKDGKEIGKTAISINVPKQDIAKRLDELFSYIAPGKVIDTTFWVNALGAVPRDRVIDIKFTPNGLHFTVERVPPILV